MSHIARLVVLGVVVAMQQGCNSVTKLGAPEAQAPAPGWAIAIYGVGIEGSFGYPSFEVKLDEYSMERKSITGGCFRHNHMKAAVAADSKRVERFAFEVRPGHYVYSGFNTGQLKGGPIAFEIPADRVVYLGDFIYSRGEVELRREQAPPILQKDAVSLAMTAFVPYPTVFVCTP